MAETTTYRVETLYEVSDKASKALEEIGKHAQNAAHSSETLKSALMGFAAGVIGSSAFHKAKEMFIGFNAEIEQMKIGLSTIISANFHTSFERAAETSGRMYDEFTRFSQTLPVTTKQLFEFSMGVDQAVVANGGNIRDMINISEQGVVAAKALGVESGYAASELSHMLGGQVNNRMLFAKNLVGMLGMTTEEWRKLDAAKRLTLTKQVLNSDAMKGATKAFGESFAGVTSTMEDKLQILGGKIGLPLFKAITAEVKSWNEWLDKNNYKIEKWAHSVGDALVTGFGYVKTAVGFMVDHASILIKIAEAWAMMKVGGAIGGGLAGTLSGFGVGGGHGGPSIFKGIGAKGGYGAGASMGMLGAAAGIGLGVGTAANQLLGLSDAISRSTEVHGQVLNMADKTTKQYVSLINSMDVFDDSVARAASELNKIGGAGGSTASANLAGTQQYFATQANVVADVIRNWNPDSGHNKYVLNHAGREAGLTDEQISQVLGGGGSQLLAQLGQKANELSARQASATPAVNDMLSGLSEDVKTNANVVQALMQWELQNMPNNSQGVYMTGKVLAEFVSEHLGPDSALKSQAKTNQTINVTINQVAAKDPDRWIADMEDYAAKKVRARTRAKGAMARGQ